MSQPRHVSMFNVQHCVQPPSPHLNIQPPSPLLTYYTVTWRHSRQYPVRVFGIFLACFLFFRAHVQLVCAFICFFILGERGWLFPPLLVFILFGTSTSILNQPPSPQSPNIPQLGGQTTPLLSKFIEAQSEIWKHKYVPLVPFSSSLTDDIHAVLTILLKSMVIHYQ